MESIAKLLLGDGRDDWDDEWDGRGRRARVADSRDWCQTGPGEGDIRLLDFMLRAGGRRSKVTHPLVRPDR